MGDQLTWSSESGRIVLPLVTAAWMAGFPALRPLLGCCGSERRRVRGDKSWIGGKHSGWKTITRSWRLGASTTSDFFSFLSKDLFNSLCISTVLLYLELTDKWGFCAALDLQSQLS